MGYSPAAVRALVDQALSSEELITLTFDDFQPVYNQFTDGQIKSLRVRLLVEYAFNVREVEKLLKSIEEANPRVFAEFRSRLLTETGGAQPAATSLATPVVDYDIRKPAASSFPVDPPPELGNFGHDSGDSMDVRQPTNIIYYAIARFKNHKQKTPMYVGRNYVLQTGIKPAILENRTSSTSVGDETIGFEIVLRVADMTILPSIMQAYAFRPMEEPPLVEFLLSPTKSGWKEIFIEFYRQQHFFSHLQFEVEVAESLLSKST